MKMTEFWRSGKLSCISVSEHGAYYSRVPMAVFYSVAL